MFYPIQKSLRAIYCSVMVTHGCKMSLKTVVKGCHKAVCQNVNLTPSSHFRLKVFTKFDIWTCKISECCSENSISLRKNGWLDEHAFIFLVKYKLLPDISRSTTSDCSFTFIYLFDKIRFWVFLGFWVDFIRLVNILIRIYN